MNGFKGSAISGVQGRNAPQSSDCAKRSWTGSRRESPWPWLRSTPIAHRGLHDLSAGVPENSSLAFAACLAAGVPIELDVRLSRDGVPMVIHDDDLRRACGLAGSVAASPADALRQLALFGTAATIPTLAETLQQVAGRVPLLIELKTHRSAGGSADGPAGALEPAVQRLLATYRGACAVQSFNPHSVRWFAEHAPAVLRGQLVAARAGSRPGGALRRLALAAGRCTRPDFLAIELRALGPLYAACAHALSPCILAWTVRTEAERARCSALGVNIIFEHPSATASP